MELLGIYGSPRKGGNTDTMLDHFLAGAESEGASVAKVYVRRLKIQGCLGCGGCDETGTCVVDDDMSQVYPLFHRCPRIVVAAPIYFYGIPGPLKSLIDRSQACFMKNQLARQRGEASARAWRRGFLLAAGATRGKRLFDCAILTARYFFDALDMDYAGQWCVREVDEKGAIEKLPDALQQCHDAGQRFVSR